MMKMVLLKVKYRMLFPGQCIKRDEKEFAFALNRKQKAQQLEQMVFAFSHKLVQRVR